MREAIHPLHSRSLSVTLTQGPDETLAVAAVLLDLRKRGIVPVGGDLATPGIVHHMLLDAVIDPGERAVRSIAARQPSVAFEPCALTGGESCRDPIERIEAVCGAPLDGSFPQRLSAAVGGIRGCSHILTLAQQLGSATAWALRPGAVRPIDPARRDGERVFRRDITIDGQQRDGAGLEFIVQLTDLYFAPTPALASPMARFAAVHELRLWAQTDSAMTLSEIRAMERRRERETLDSADWCDRTARAALVLGVPLFRGVSAALRSRLGDAPDDPPLLDALLMIAPTFIQVCAALSDRWPAAAAAAGDSLVGMGGIPDSCYMWRRGGALDRARSSNDPTPTL